MRMILIRICTIIEQYLLSEPRAGLNIEQFSASVPLIIAAGTAVYFATPDELRSEAARVALALQITGCIRENDWYPVTSTA